VLRARAIRQNKVLVGAIFVLREVGAGSARDATCRPDFFAKAGEAKGNGRWDQTGTVLSVRVPLGRCPAPTAKAIP